MILRFAAALLFILAVPVLLQHAPVAAQSQAPAPQASPAPAELAPQATARPEPVVIRDAAAPAHDLSPWSMFLGADIVVKSVMVGLAVASLATWTILLAKSFEFSLAQRHINRAIERLGGCGTLADAERIFPQDRKSVVARLIHEAAAEARLSAGIGAGGGIRDRASARCAEVVRAESRRLRVGTGMLATIGSTAPFVGLFGTVWGIMNSFVGIAKAQTTNLAVVAPGIAEALFATAIGLVAAIPAVIIYNHFARVTKNHLERVNHASGIVLRLLSRDIDHARAGVVEPAGG